PAKGVGLGDRARVRAPGVDRGIGRVEGGLRGARRGGRDGAPRELDAQGFDAQRLHLFEYLRLVRPDQRGARLEEGRLAAGRRGRGGGGRSGGQDAGEDREREGAEFWHGPLRHLSAGKVAVDIAFRAVSAPIAPDDIVRTTAEGEANSRPPLLVLDPL